MKIRLQFISWLTVLLITVISCDKDVNVSRGTSGVVPPTVTSSSSSGLIIHGNRDYFWGYPWQKTSRGYEIHLDTWRLTAVEINKGINVHVAVWTEMTTFERIPLAFYDFLQQDTIHLSYTAIPGQLQVIATAPFEVKYASDIFIEYQ
ncbi:MAG TPA: hypothetical protein VGQ09_05125 [Chitinophagaceae bacterium]|nr:hypothetical protein [Chitinophagaceae bacterium]